MANTWKKANLEGMEAQATCKEMQSGNSYINITASYSYGLEAESDARCLLAV
jgi:hypothetical protein